MSPQNFSGFAQFLYPPGGAAPDKAGIHPDVGQSGKGLGLHRIFRQAAGEYSTGWIVLQLQCGIGRGVFRCKQGAYRTGSLGHQTERLLFRAGKPPSGVVMQEQQAAFGSFFARTGQRNVIGCGAGGKVPLQPDMQRLRCRQGQFPTLQPPGQFLGGKTQPQSTDDTHLCHMLAAGHQQRTSCQPPLHQQLVADSGGLDKLQRIGPGKINQCFLAESTLEAPSGDIMVKNDHHLRAARRVYLRHHGGQVSGGTIVDETPIRG